MPTAKVSRDVIAELYSSLCADPELPAAIQWRIYDYAVQVRKPVLAAKLLGVQQLDPNLDAALGTRDDAKVRAAWIARPGRSVDDVLRILGGPRSVAVCSAVAAVKGLPAAAYRHAGQDESRATTQALLENADVPADVKERAAAVYGNRYAISTGMLLNRKLEELFSDQLGLLVPLVSQTAHLGVIEWAASRVSFSADDIERMIESVLMPQLTSSADEDYRALREISAAAAAVLGQENLGPDQREILWRSLTSVLGSWGPSVQKARSWKLVGSAYSSPPKRLPSASHPHLDLMRSAATAAQVAAAARMVLSSRDPELAVALAVNQFSDAATVKSLLPLIPSSVISRIADTRVYDLDVLATIVVHNTSFDIFSDELLHASGRPTDALLSIVREFRASGRPISARLARSEYLTPAAMGALPLSFTAGKATMLSRRAITDLLVAALDSDSDWQMFQNLGNSFDGPLENLLLACGYISADHTQHVDRLEAAAAAAQHDGGDEAPTLF